MDTNGYLSQPLTEGSVFIIEADHIRITKIAGKLKMKIKGLPAFQRKALKKNLRKNTYDDEFEICFNDSISLRRLHSLWYGGNVVDVKYKGYTFHIEASGEVRCNLNRTNNDNPVCYLKDKSKNGVFDYEMLSYIRFDKTLYKTLNHEHRKFYLEMYNNNWWECFITDDKGVFHDIMWTLDNDDLFISVANVIENFDEMIVYLKGAA
ncbi:MAG: hypothetical protein FWE27_08920 [Defluviitaleaceae bacterium]|nr:hypothetical protein [Defluviitaleaceae bacterium]